MTNSLENVVPLTGAESRSSNQTQERHPHITDEKGRVLMNYMVAEFDSDIHHSLFSAMGAKLFRAYRFGEGTPSIPDKLRASVRELQGEYMNLRVSYAEHLEGDRYKRHLFIEKTLVDGSRCVYVVDADRSHPYVFRLEKLYIVSREGRTCDLLKETNPDTKAYFVPYANSAYVGDADTLFFGDLDMVSQVLDCEGGFLPYLHEIGHLKDWRINGHLYERFLERMKLGQIITPICRNLERLLAILTERCEISDIIIARLRHYANTYAEMITYIEANASSWARLFICNRAKTGANFSPTDSSNLARFAPLERSLAAYRMVLWGISQENYTPENLPIPREIPNHYRKSYERLKYKAFIAMLKILLEGKVNE